MKKEHVSGLILASIIASGAQAYEVTESKKNIEIGLEYGNYEQEFSIDGYQGELTGDDTGYRVFATFYQSSNVGIRIGYTDFGEAVIDEGYVYDGFDYAPYSDESSISAFTVGAVLSTPITDGPWELSAEIGLARWDLEETFSYNSIAYGTGSETESDTGISIYGGIGARIQVSENFGVGLNILWYVIEADIFDEKTDVQVDAMTLNGVYRF